MAFKKQIRDASKDVVANGLQLKKPPNFAQELVDRVIDSLGHGKVLLACALVCRDWLPRSRLRYFDYDVLLIHGEALPSIANLLSSEHESISPFIASLAVEISQEEKLLEVVSKFSRARKITDLVVSGWSSLTPALKTCLLSFPISELTLTGKGIVSLLWGDLASLDDLVGVLRAFPALESFRAVKFYPEPLKPPGLAEEERNLVVPCSLAPPSGLTKLYLNDTSWGPITRWLMALKDENFPRIRTLDVELNPQDDMGSGKDLIDLIRRLGSTLRSLTLTAQHHLRELPDQDIPCICSEMVWNHLDLSFNPRLKQLTIETGSYCTPREINAMVSIVLPRIPSSIEVLTLDIRSYYHGKKIWPDAGVNMGTALDAPQFKNLAKLRLCGFPQDYEVISAFNEFRDNGVLVFLNAAGEVCNY